MRTPLARFLAGLALATAATTGTIAIHHVVAPTTLADTAWGDAAPADTAWGTPPADTTPPADPTTDAAPLDTAWG